MRSNGKILEKLDKLCFVLICVLMADCCIFGPGRFIEFGPIGFRMGLFMLTLVLALPLMLKNAWIMLKNSLVQIVLAFLCWIVFCAFRGVMNGNSMSHLVSDLKGFAYLAFLPVVLSVVCDRKRVHILTKTVMYSSAVVAILCIVSLLFYLVAPSTLFPALYEILTMSHGKDYGIASFTSISRTLLRCYFYSGLYMLAGCAFSVYYQVTGEKFRWRYAVITGLCLFGLLMTYTRSVYFASFIAAATLVAVWLIKTTGQEKRRLFAQLGAGILVLAVLLTAFGLTAKTDYLRYGLSRVLVTFADEGLEDPGNTQQSKPTGDYGQSDLHNGGSASDYNAITVESDKLRAMTVAEMMTNIRRAPVIGNGLGVALQCRADGYSEYFYLDMLSKTGMIGVLLYMAPLIYMIIMLLTNRRMDRRDKQLTTAWLVVVLGMCAYSYFNPYMNAALGIFCYCCTMGVFCVCRKD